MNYIHIAGTNAKGSVSEYIYRILLAAGYKCGVFTSPHLFSPTERMRMNGSEISLAEYKEYMEKAGLEEGEHLFRAWTRAALAWFDDNAVDFAVIEAGIGGSRDSTNVVNAKLAILTPISLDHTQLLGKTVEKIARDKCGIIKEGATVISFGQTKSVMRVIEESCKKKGARLLKIGDYSVQHADVLGQIFCYRDFEALKINAISPAQVENACAAAEAAIALGIPEDAIREGLEKTVLRARAQAADPNLIVDGAHNPGSMLELERTIKKYYAGRNVLVLTAVMRDKDAAKMAAIIKKFAGRVICTCIDRKRGLPAIDYAKHFGKTDYFSDARSAFAYARIQKPDVLVVCGSFYLASRILEINEEAR